MRQPHPNLSCRHRVLDWGLSNPTRLKDYTSWSRTRKHVCVGCGLLKEREGAENKCVCVCACGFTSATSLSVNPETHCQVDSVAKADIASLCCVEESRL